MRKRFKTKRKKNIKFSKIIIIISILYIIYYIVNNYLNKLDNITIINYIIDNTKLQTTDFINKISDPNYILSNNFIYTNDSITVSNETNPTIYIYNTHDTETYNDTYLEIYNIKPTVKTISYILKDYLNNYNINTEIETTPTSEILKSHNWSYKYSYDAAREIIKNKIEENNYQLIIDLHRDSGSKEKTLLSYNDKNYAKVLFVVGTEHENYEQNYRVSEELNNIIESLLPGISRGISKKSGEGVNGIYNQDINSNMVLIEVGGEYNEIEEINNTLEILAQAIQQYIERIT